MSEGNVSPPTRQHEPIVKEENSLDKVKDEYATLPATPNPGMETPSGRQQSLSLRSRPPTSFPPDHQTPENVRNASSQSAGTESHGRVKGSTYRRLADIARLQELHELQKTFGNIIELDTGDRYAMSCHRCGVNAEEGSVRRSGVAWFTPERLQVHYQSRHKTSLGLIRLLDECRLIRIDDEDQKRILNGEEPMFDLSPKLEAPSKRTKSGQGMRWLYIT